MQRKIINSFQGICNRKREINIQTLQEVMVIAIEIAREGREGRKIGTMFVIGDEKIVLEKSRCLILDPLLNHPSEVKHIEDVNLRETVKELAQLDGAFIVSDEGVVLSACRHIDAPSSGIDQPLGLGSRHMAAAAITKHSKALAVVVSESSIVRIFENGDIIGEIIPELWLLRHQNYHKEKNQQNQANEKIAVTTKTY